MPITDCRHKTFILIIQHVVPLILSRVECFTLPFPLRTSMLRARASGPRRQYSCGAGLLRVAQLPQVRCPVCVHPRDRRTEPRHKGAARFHVRRLCCSQTRPNSPPRVFDRRKPKMTRTTQTTTQTAEFHWPRAPAPQHVPRESYRKSASIRSG